MVNPALSPNDIVIFHAHNLLIKSTVYLRAQCFWERRKLPEMQRYSRPSKSRGAKGDWSLIEQCRCWPHPHSCAPCDAASGEDLVPEQTGQREENKQEEAATFPAGLHDDARLSGLRRLQRRPRRPQPPPHHAVGHSIGRVLGQKRQDCDPTEECVVVVCFIAKEQMKIFHICIWHFNPLPPFFAVNENFSFSPTGILVSHSTRSYLRFISASVSYWLLISKKKKTNKQKCLPKLLCINYKSLGEDRWVSF